MEVFADIPNHYREALSVFEALRRLGFSPDNIFIVRSLIGETYVLSVALKQGEVTFTTGVAIYTGSEDQLLEEWPKVCALVKTALEKELQDMYESSAIALPENGRRLVYGMMAKGITPPRMLN